MEEKNTNSATGEEKVALQKVSNHKETINSLETETKLEEQNESNSEASEIIEINSPEEKRTSKPIEAQEDFSGLKADDIVQKLKTLVEGQDWFKSNKTIQSLQSQYQKLFQEDLEVAKNDFLASSENEINFFYKPDHKKEFDQITFSYRQLRRKHFKEIETAQKINLERKKNIIEEIKKLITTDQDINSVYKKFKSLQDSWYNTGPVPRAENQNIWQTFRHHVERFYDFLHLNRELRELDFKHNYEAKLKLIERAEELAKFPDIVRASRELNVLHQTWKNDLGPVIREQRELLWKRFQEATKTIQKKRQEYQKDLAGSLKANFECKNQILTQMKGFLSSLPEQHREWQHALKKFQELREEFKSVGHVAGKNNKIIWQEFREIGKEFMKAKNDFYKLQKKEQKENVNAKNNLIEHLVSVLESEDWKSRVDEVKNLQKKWKVIGFIPRKIDNKLWTIFQEKNTLYFDRLRSGYQKLDAQDEALIKTRNKFIESAKKQKLKGNSEKVSEQINKIWEDWDDLNQLKPILIQELDNALAKGLIEKIKNHDLKPSEKKKLEYECKVLALKKNDKGLNEAIKEIRVEIKNQQTEINQLENNLEFFSSSSTENPLFKEAEKKIGKIKKALDQNHDKLIQLNQIKNTLTKKKSAQEQENIIDSDKGNGEIFNE
tara:strand:+ start:2301 stop:4292 length:1992 start_codon:yes stop_codon:yes gene_type:complete